MNPKTTQKDLQLEQVMPLIRQRLLEGGSVRFSPHGTSMLPMIRQGIDSVELSPLPEKLKKYDLPLYQRDDGQYVLHRIVSVKQTYTCIGDNQFVYEPGVRHDQMLALVTAFYRKDRRIAVTQWQYRLYCRFWHHSRFFRWLWRGGLDRLRKWLRIS